MIRTIAFHLPQFHPVPENDAWWGKGFTEWTNVTRTTTRFPGHYQPHLPTDLGFYDLRLPEARLAQATLAAEFGLHGFCYYHYWFNGRRILERPVNDILSSGEPDFPFCLCWANENWTRQWDGKDKEVLLKQRYSREDDLAHIRELIETFRDKRYIKVAGKPFFLVYRLSQLPDIEATTTLWREEVEKAGFPGLYLCNVESSSSEHGLAAATAVDAAVEFAPDWSCLPQRIKATSKRFRLLGRDQSAGYSDNRVFRYSDMVDRMQSKADVKYTRFRCVTPMWDNSARRSQDATIFIESTPQQYEHWLKETVANAYPPSREENFVFINAWNEWAEGNHLEPCSHWGTSYLEATRSAISAGLAELGTKVAKNPIASDPRTPLTAPPAS